MSQELLFLLIGLVLTIGTGLFVASEFALVNLDRAELEARRHVLPRLRPKDKIARRAGEQRVETPSARADAELLS